jgi:hypothetical protein
MVMRASWQMIEERAMNSDVLSHYDYVYFAKILYF